jgi:hypothetical protein
MEHCEDDSVQPMIDQHFQAMPPNPDMGVAKLAEVVGALTRSPIFILSTWMSSSVIREKPGAGPRKSRELRT